MNGMPGLGAAQAQWPVTGSSDSQQPDMTTRGEDIITLSPEQTKKPFLRRIDCRSVTNPCNLFYDYFMICKVSILESFMISLIQGTFNKETQIDRNSTKLV